MPPRSPQTLPDPARRNLLRGDPLRKPPPLRPPWTDEGRLAAACTRCGDCVSACPEKVLRSGDGGFPEFYIGAPDAPGALCTFCGACAEACEVDVFDKARVPPWQVAARIAEAACLAQKGIHCESCRDSCLEDAIVFRPRVGGPPMPQITLADCSGCGACLGTCPVQALELHQPARPVEVA